jgi:hypothetical protein
VDVERAAVTDSTSDDQYVERARDELVDDRWTPAAETDRRGSRAEPAREAREFP